MKTKNEFGFRRLAENRPAQRDSKFSNERLSGVFCWPQWQNIKNSPVQQDSKFSKLGNRPLSPFCLFCPLAFQNHPAQPDSRMSKLILSLCTLRTPRLKWLSAQPDSKFSKFKKNQTLHSLNDLHGEEMYSAQRHSNISNLCDFAYLDFMSFTDYYKQQKYERTRMAAKPFYTKDLS